MLGDLLSLEREAGAVLSADLAERRLSWKLLKTRTAYLLPS